MEMKKMTIDEVKKYYGTKYSKIINALKNVKKELIFSIDVDCGKYLELTCNSAKNSDFYFKVNHGISNEFPYNTWYKPYSYCSIEQNHFRNQNEVVDYINKVLK